MHKKIRAMSHIMGEDCKCSRFPCFQKISQSERSDLIKHFNELASYDTQNAHLSGLISVLPVQRRRSRKTQAEADFRNFSYIYKMRINKDGQNTDVPVCYKAFIALRGITGRRLVTLKTSLATTGKAHTETRVKHGNRAHQMKGEILSKICQHIQSLRGQKVH